MKALQLDRPAGQPKKGERCIVEVRDVPIPRTDGDTVLLKVLSAGFNRRDEWSALGLYPGLQYGNSTLGCDGCGIVVDPQSLEPVPGATLQLVVPSRGWEEDPRGAEAELQGSTTKNEFGGSGFVILGGTKGVHGAGLFTEYIAVRRDQLVPVPKHLDANQSASLPCAAVTAYRALFTKACVQPGENVLITGIGGGVAILALQLAVAAGARVFVTGGSQAKVDRAISMGAVAGAIYHDANWPAKIREALPAQRKWLDATVDSAGGAIAEQSLKAGLRSGGRVVVFGMTAGREGVPFTMREVLKNVELMGTTLGSAREFKEAIRFIEKHHIVPVIDTIIQGIDHAREGFPLLADSEKRSGGKVVVQISTASSKTRM